MREMLGVLGLGLLVVAPVLIVTIRARLRKAGRIADAIKSAIYVPPPRRQRASFAALVLGRHLLDVCASCGHTRNDHTGQAYECYTCAVTEQRAQPCARFTFLRAAS